MLDLTNDTDRQAYEELKAASLTMSGINFALAMRKDDGTVKVYLRPNQPCQGGEMRKYEATHPGDCTRPKDSRPGDLTMPFPLGTPEAVAVRLHARDCLVEPKGWSSFLKALYGPSSPYLKGFGSPDKVEFVEHDGRIEGVIFHDTEVDPTVLVNSLQFLTTMRSNYELFDLYRAEGLTDTEALCVMMLMNSDPRVRISDTFEYYFPMRASIRRIVEGKPHDLSGGTLRDRFDYNRPQVQSLFAAGKGEYSVNLKEALEKRGLVFSKRVKKKSSWGEYEADEWIKYSISDFVAHVRALFDEAYETSKDEDLSLVTLENKGFGKSDATPTYVDYGNDEVESCDDDDYDDGYYEEDGDEIPFDGELISGEWYSFGNQGFEAGCDCSICSSAQKKYLAKQAKKKLNHAVGYSAGPITVSATVSDYILELKKAPKIAKKGA